MQPLLLPQHLRPAGKPVTRLACAGPTQHPADCPPPRPRLCLPGPRLQVGNAIGRGNRHLFLAFLWLELGALLLSTIVGVVRIHEAVSITAKQVGWSVACVGWSQRTTEGPPACNVWSTTVARC